MYNVTLLNSSEARNAFRSFATRFSGIAACAVLFAGMTLPRQAAAQNILPFPAPQATTVPSNGDVNPYGVVFVPNSVRTDGLLQPGSILVSNFNNNLNLQGTGRTIVQISPQGKTSLFFTSTGPGQQGLSAALGILSNGIVIAGYLPSTDGTSNTATAGGLLFIDRHGVLLGTITNNNTFDGPWGMAMFDRGNGAALVFVSNVLNGTVTRFEVTYNNSGEQANVTQVVTIGSGFMHSGDPAAFEVGNSGLAYDAMRDILYVDSEVDSAIYAIQHAAELTGSGGTGVQFVQDATHLHGPLDIAIAPNGHFLVANSDGRNADPNQPSELVEYSAAGKFLSQFSIDPNNGGAFGVAIQNLGNGFIRVAAVNDNQVVLNMYTTMVR